jgi:hypothetical protein
MALRRPYFLEKSRSDQKREKRGNEASLSPEKGKIKIKKTS